MEQETNTITLPTSRGSTYIQRLNSIYGTLFYHLYGFFVKEGSFAKNGAIFKRLMKDYTEIQIAYLLIVYFNWHGMDSNSQSETEWLQKKAHDIFQFQFGITKFETYVRNILNMSEVFEDDSKLLQEVGQHIISLR